MSSRPSSSPRDAFRIGKVPGGFDDDEPILNREPSSGSLRHSGGLPYAESPSSPAMPPEETSSLHARDDGASDGAEHDMDDGAEREMHRRLMDFESSFLPVPSPTVGGGASNDRSLPGKQTEPEMRPQSRATLSRSSTPPDAYRTPAPLSVASPSRGASPSPDLFHSNILALETMSSSPTAAAAARTVSRIVSMATMSAYDTADEGGLDRSREEYRDSEGEDEETPRETPRKARDASAPDARSLQAPLPTPSEPPRQRSVVQQTDEGSSSIPKVSDEHSGRASVRPHALRSRHASYRSSASSFTTNSIRSEETSSDATLGADYALQSGGAAPESSFTHRHNPALSRSTSLGSIASGMTGVEEPVNNWDKTRTVSGTHYPIDPVSGLDMGLSTLDEERDSQVHVDAYPAADDKGTATTSEETPKASGRVVMAPTDTVVAQHVRDVQVPASVAREYRERHPLMSPEKKAEGRASLTGRGKGLTLKEQSSTIDRLQKENFDLKLKIHYLNKALNERSDEGIKKMISENVELKVGLATMEKQNRTLRRTVAELQRRLDEREEVQTDLSPLTGESDEDAGRSSRSKTANRAIEEEVTYLRQRVEVYEKELERLMNEGEAKDGERKRFAESMRSFGEKKRAYFDVGAREEMDMWKDLYEAETARREQADETVKRLQEEIWRLKNNGSVATTNGHTRATPQINRGNRPATSHSFLTGAEYILERNSVATTASSTLVEQLRHENEELRREVSAQTSMLTSRNREKERLYQEIEDLKLGQMRGDGGRSIAGDSIFERSASRAFQRPVSRASGLTRTTALSDAEREEYEQKQGQLRDSISELKLRNQELERKLNECLDELEQHDSIRASREKEFEEELDQATRDLQTMQNERDEALLAREEIEAEFDNLKQEAQQEISNLEANLEQRLHESQQLEGDLSNRNENFNALQTEMRSMSEIVVRLEDDHRSCSRKTVTLQQELNDANKEIEALENDLREANAKIERFTVQQESSQGEIAFLREEQDADKMKIGDLESALRKSQDGLREEQERIKELETRIAEERRQSETIANQEKQEVQRIANELNQELASSRDEVRKLRKNLSSREMEAAEWKERLLELENDLRTALGDLSGTRSSLLKSVTKLQKELESTVAELDKTKNRLAETERILRRRDGLLESAGLETQKLSEMLDKERHARKVDKHHYEQLEKTCRQSARTASQHEARTLELETARQNDRRKLNALEAQYKEQLMERNNLFLAVWNRLSTLCGNEWIHKYSHVNGKVPSIEVIATMLTPFSKNLILAVKTVESIIGGFKNRIRTIERDLWKEYQALEHNLDIRIKKLDRLETMVQADMAADSSSSSTEIARLKSENRNLKAELRAQQRQEAPTRPGHPQRYPSGGVASREANPAALASLTRHYSTSAVETLERLGNSHPAPESSSPGDPSDQRWIVRLRELERRLKAEREARLIDRDGARRRLQEGKAENEELKMRLERDRVRNGE